jgi:hypothetical protein
MPKTEEARGGRYTRSPETAQRDSRCAELRAKGWTYRAIAVDMDIHVGSAYDAVQRALRAIVEEPAEEVAPGAGPPRHPLRRRHEGAGAEPRHGVPQQGRRPRRPAAGGRRAGAPGHRPAAEDPGTPGAPTRPVPAARAGVVRPTPPGCSSADFTPRASGRRSEVG